MTVAVVEPGGRPERWSVPVPGSKSITNRMLALAAVADGTSRIANALPAGDTQVMVEAIEALGAGVAPTPEGDGWTVRGLGGPPRARPGTSQIWCGMAGTAARFLPALCAAGRGSFGFDADPQLRGRPLGPLLGALVAQGAAVEPEGAATLPFTLRASGLAGGRVAVEVGMSSQFLSGLMLAAPFSREEATFDATFPVSRPYIDLTIDAMRAFGVDVQHDAATIAVAPQRYRAADLTVEPDASTASYFLAASALTGSTVTIPGLDLATTRQGDARLAHLLARMGCRIVKRGPLTLQGAPELRGIEADMSECSDVFMTLACVAPFASSPTTISGIGHVRRKESDRIDAVATNLARLGAGTEVGADFIRVYPSMPRSARLPTFRDHRIAMAFALVGLRVPVEIEEPEVVAKTCPSFFELWTRSGAAVHHAE